MQTSHMYVPAKEPRCGWVGTLVYYCTTLFRAPSHTQTTCSQADISAALDLLQQRYSKHIPPGDLVKCFCVCDKLPALDEYLEIFDAPIEVDFECDKVWPAAAPLTF